jgi:hypothetical protein
MNSLTASLMYLALASLIVPAGHFNPKAFRGQIRKIACLGGR